METDVLPHQEKPIQPNESVPDPEEILSSIDPDEPKTGEESADPDPLDALLVKSPHRADCGVYIHSQNGRRVDKTVEHSIEPSRMLTELTAWAEAAQLDTYYQAAGLVPKSPKEWNGQAPTTEDIRLWCGLEIDLDDDKRTPKYQGKPGKVKAHLKRALFERAGVQGYFITETSPGNFNILIPMRPSDDSKGKSVEKQKQRLKRILIGRGKNNPGLLRPLGADPHASGRTRLLRMPGVKRTLEDGIEWTPETEWIEREDDARYSDGKRSSWWAPEETFEGMAIPRYASRFNCLPRGWNNNCPHGGISKNDVAWAILSYFFLNPDHYRGTLGHLAEGCTDWLEQDVQPRHVTRALEMLEEDDVLEYETKQGRGGGLTVKLTKQHKRPRNRPQEASPTPKMSAKSYGNKFVPNLGSSVETGVTVKPTTSPGSVASSCLSGFGIEVNGEGKSHSTEQNEGNIPEKKCCPLKWEPEEGKRHRKIVETAVFLVANGEEKSKYKEWVRQKVPRDQGRGITTQETERVWTWAKGNVA